MSLHQLDSVSTCEFPTVRNLHLIAPSRRRKWSRARCVAGVVALMMSFAFVIDVVIQPRHGLDELPQIALDVFRANWVLAVAAALLAWAYEIVSPKVFTVLGRLRDGVRAVEYGQSKMADQLKDQSLELAAVRRAALRAAMEADLRLAAQDEKLCKALNAMQETLERSAAQSVNDYADAFASGFERGRQHPAEPAPELDDKVIKMTTARRRHV